MQNRLQIDGPDVSRDEAVECCLDHLELAAMFFEATPDDKGAQLMDGLERRASQRTLNRRCREFECLKAFIEVIVTFYEAMKDRD